MKHVRNLKLVSTGSKEKSSHLNCHVFRKIYNFHLFPLQNYKYKFRVKGNIGKKEERKVTVYPCIVACIVFSTAPALYTLPGGADLSRGALSPL